MLRIWLSYEYWLETPERFECCGAAQTPEGLLDTNPLTAVDVNSPSDAIFQQPQRWEERKRFVRWMMEQYRDDPRLLVIEVVNEPKTMNEFRFARAMFEAAAAHRGAVPLTVGSIKVEDNLYYLDRGIDVFSFHGNFPQSEHLLWPQKIPLGLILRRIIS